MRLPYEKVPSPRDCDAFWEAMNRDYPDYVQLDRLGHATALNYPIRVASVGSPDVLRNPKAGRNALVVQAHENEHAGFAGETSLGKTLLRPEVLTYLCNTGCVVHFSLLAADGHATNPWAHRNHNSVHDLLTDVVFNSKRVAGTAQAPWGLDVEFPDYTFNAYAPEALAYQDLLDRLLPNVVVETHGMQVGWGVFVQVNEHRTAARMVGVPGEVADQHGLPLDVVGDPGSIEIKNRLRGGLDRASRTRDVYERALARDPSRKPDIGLGGSVVDYLDQRERQALVARVEPIMLLLTNVNTRQWLGRPRHEVDAAGRELETRVPTRYREEIGKALDMSAGVLADAVRARHGIGGVRPPIERPDEPATASDIASMMVFGPVYAGIIAGMACRLVASVDKAVGEKMKGELGKMVDDLCEIAGFKYVPYGTQVDYTADTTLAGVEVGLGLKSGLLTGFTRSDVFTRPLER